MLSCTRWSKQILTSDPLQRFVFPSQIRIFFLSSHFQWFVSADVSPSVHFVHNCQKVILFFWTIQYNKHIDWVVMFRILILLILAVFIHVVTARRRCINSGILFPDKILRSPIVLYGESIGKQVYLDNDIELLFNVTFRVDCIFKGQDVPNRIILTQAGRNRFNDGIFRFHYLFVSSRCEDRSYRLSMVRTRSTLCCFCWKMGNSHRWLSTVRFSRTLSRSNDLWIIGENVSSETSSAVTINRE